MALVSYAERTDDVLSIICDYDIETAWTSYRHYLGLRRVHEGVKKRTVSISFADDKAFPALQGADLMVSLARHEARQQFYGIKNIWKPLFDQIAFKRSLTSKIHWYSMFADEKKSKNLLQKPLGGEIENIDVAAL